MACQENPFIANCRCVSKPPYSLFPRGHCACLSLVNFTVFNASESIIMKIGDFAWKGGMRRASLYYTKRNGSSEMLRNDFVSSGLDFNPLFAVSPAAPPLTSRAQLPSPGSVYLSLISATSRSWSVSHYHVYSHSSPSSWFPSTLPAVVCRSAPSPSAPDAAFMYELTLGLSAGQMCSSGALELALKVMLKCFWSLMLTTHRRLIFTCLRKCIWWNQDFSRAEKDFSCNRRQGPKGSRLTVLDGSCQPSGVLGPAWRHPGHLNWFLSTWRGRSLSPGYFSSSPWW